MLLNSRNRYDRVVQSHGRGMFHHDVTTDIGVWTYVAYGYMSTYKNYSNYFEFDLKADSTGRRLEDMHNIMQILKPTSKRNIHLTTTVHRKHILY